MKNWKEILLTIVGGIGWLMLGIACLLLGALDNAVGVWLCVVSLALGFGMVYFGLDKALEPKRRW